MDFTAIDVFLSEYTKVVSQESNDSDVVKM